MLGKKCMDYLQTLGKISSTTNGLTRLILTQEHKKSIDLISSWMKGLNLDIEIDDIGNVIGTYKSNFPNAPTLVVASHQDSVKCGGIFDGMLGIIVPLVGLEEAKHNNKSYPFNIKLIAFAEEEGTRFETSLMGSKVFAGTFKEELLKSVDENGITLEEAVTKFGFNTKNLTNLHPRKDVDAYLEFHIEQGPVLENESLPAGIVSSITGFKSFKISVNGKSGHAGTLPMNMRLDAGCCACECVLAIEKVAKTTADLVATVGKMNFYPSSSNVVPERAEFTLEILIFSLCLFIFIYVFMNTSIFNSSKTISLFYFLYASLFVFYFIKPVWWQMGGKNNLPPIFSLFYFSFSSKLLKYSSSSSNFFHLLSHHLYVMLKSNF